MATEESLFWTQGAFSAADCEIYLRPLKIPTQDLHARPSNYTSVAPKYEWSGLNVDINAAITKHKIHLDILFDRIFTRINAPGATGTPIFDGLCPDRYRNRRNGRRVATSTSTLTAYLHVFMRPGQLGRQFLTACAWTVMEIGQTAAEWRRRHPILPHIYTY